MAYTLKMAIGAAIYRARTCTVEPVIGIIKEVLGFRSSFPATLWRATRLCCDSGARRAHRRRLYSLGARVPPRVTPQRRGALRIGRQPPS